ncbi:hypothetical protein BC332_27189 [Capsicum chinense]|nr:hypothetical protein BC332_27189 [Capsicum chinense]
MFLRRRLGSSVDELVHEFEAGWEPKMEGYSRKLVEFCCSKGLTDVCSKLEDTLVDGSFSRITFDMMLAWEMPSSADEERHSECVAKEKEDRKATCKMPREQDDILLFYSDVMPLLVDNEPSVGEDAFLWLGTLVHLVADIVNGRFSFEMLTASTENRLHYPAYDMFLKEIEKCVKHLQTQATPTGMEMADDEFILHVEGTASSQRVVRHIGGTSWPGRLTLTNYALYFEASGVISYKEAIKLDLSKDSEQSVKTAATGPWGAPLYDKAIIYESSELQGVVFEFPEMTSSTRRDHWLSLVKEIMLLHRFLRKFKVDSPLESWEMHARTILGIIRLHAAREMLRISPPVPKNFLIFDLLDELPKGDYVLKELAESLNKVDAKHPCSASSILRSLNVSQLFIPSVELKEINDNTVTSPVQVDNVSSLESAIDQSREEAKEIQIAKATVEELKGEGIGNNVQVLMGLLKPLKKLVPYVQEAFTWERPLSSTILVVTTMAVIYNEWVGKAIAALLLGIVATMIWARHRRIPDKVHRIVVYTGSDQTTMESIVSAQQGLRSVYHLIQTMNVIILKIWSVLVSKAPKHADMVMVALVVAAVILSVVPFKFILMALASYGFVAASKIGKSKQNEKGNRRLHEWWDSIPVVPVDIVDEIDSNT